MKLRIGPLLLTLIITELFSGMLTAEDWPQWMGPNRDNHWIADDILTRFPEDGPKVVWRAPVEIGYAGPAVVGNRLFVADFLTRADVKVSNFNREKTAGTERIRCLDATSGKELWKHQYPVTYAISYPSGPRCTPIVDGDQVFSLGAEGHLICFQRENGNVIWSRDLKQDYSTNSALWGYASHPLIDGDKLICIVGGEGSHTVAFNKRTGEEIWRHGSASEQGYSPPKIIRASGVRQLILCSPDYVESVNPETGKRYWQQEYVASNGSIIMTPVHDGNYLFVGGYSNCNLMLELDPNTPGAKKLFRDKTKLGMSPVNVQPMVDDHLLIGMDQSGALMAVEIPSGKRLWETGQPLAERPIGNGTAFIVKHKNRFLLFTEAGELVFANINRDGYQEIDRAKVIDATNNAFRRPVIWSAPAYANGRMYVRNDKECLCIELTQGR